MQTRKGNTIDPFPDGIPDHFILLDSESTVSVFNNPHLVTDIRESAHPLILMGNGGGSQKITKVGIIPSFGEVWFSPESSANILALSDVRKTPSGTIYPSAQARWGVMVYFRSLHT